MKKLLIVTDARMFITEDNRKFKVSIDNNHYKRYLQFSNNINMLMRTESVDTEKIGKMNEITIPELNIISCPSLMSFSSLIKNYKKANNIIEYQIKDADYIVLKVPGIFCNLAYKYIKKYKKIYFAEIGGCPWDGYWNHGFSGKIMAPYMYFNTKKIMKNASYSLYVTKFFLENRYPTNGNYVNCSNVTLEDFDTNKLNRRIDKINNSSNDSLVLCTVADLDVRFKGQQYIIKAIPKIKKELGINIKYVLIGRGSPNFLIKIAEKYNVKDDIIIKGSLKHEDVFKELEKIDIYVQPSRQEGLPRAVIEAMSCAVPCFGANTAGIPELIEKKYIFSNSHKNIREIVSIIKNMNNKFELIRLSKLNFEKSKEYDYNVLKTRRERIYNDYIMEVCNEKKD